MTLGLGAPTIEIPQSEERTNFRNEWLRRSRAMSWKIRDRIYLSGRSIHREPMNEMQQKFARLFRETWIRIPLWARRPMFKHWRRDFHGVRVIGAPAIYVSDWWPDREPGQLGVCGQRGHRLNFWAKAVLEYPDENVRELIAHELAHVLQHARSTTDVGSDRWVPRWCDDFELEADEIMEAWDFDSSALDDLPILDEDLNAYSDEPEAVAKWLEAKVWRERHAA